MDARYSRLFAVLAMGVVTVLLVGCEAEYPESLYNPNFQGRPTPVITSIIPPDSALAGIGQIIIKGENFSPVMEENFVYFGKTQAELVSASATELRVKTPNVTGDSLNVKVAVHGALLFSNVVKYKLLTAIWDWGAFLAADDPWGITCDADENLYVDLTTRNIDRVTSDNLRSTYGTVPFVKGTGMKMGPGGYLYVARTTTALYRIPPGGGAAVKWVDAPGKVYDFDFAPSKSMYAGGDGDFLYLIKPDGTGSKVANYRKVYMRAVRVFDGYVYVGGRDSTGQQHIWRNQILADDQVGPTEVYFAWSAKVDPTSQVYALTFAQDGDMYVGTDHAAGIMIVHRDGSFEPLYEGLLKPYVYSLAWGTSSYLYANQRNDTDPAKKRMLKINVLKQSAPYYGRE
ncbi:MAG: IPT/TIG domain-containing protein [bacterium]|nr:IPT/TIG domain-containing protein [candidate division KSB1 bacterium]MDH7561283.1 IPT/TIG domain-containing protein [bacterium]